MMDSGGTLALGLQGVGALYLGKLALSLIAYVFNLFLKPGASLSKFKAAKDWAVVTGATDGIGKAYAMALAKKGLNVLIVSRSQDKLDAVRQEIVDKHPGVEVRAHRTDFTALDNAALDALIKAMGGLQVGVLVNNVAVNVEMPTYFDELELAKVRDIITCNTLGTALLTHAVLPQMKARKRGVIINLSSLGGTLPSAMLQPYGASKSFVENFSEAIAEETKRCARRAALPCGAARGGETRRGRPAGGSRDHPAPLRAARAAGTGSSCSATCPTSSRPPWRTARAPRSPSRSRATLWRRRSQSWATALRSRLSGRTRSSSTRSAACRARCSCRTCTTCTKPSARRRSGRRSARRPRRPGRSRPKPSASVAAGLSGRLAGVSIRRPPCE